jgi:two-component system sensor histidine kinase EvgS
MTHEKKMSPAEQRWIDQHPIVHFSIHEKYAPYLQAGRNNENAGVFYGLLKKLGEFTGQEFSPKWRKTEQEGLKQLANGEVNFMIDPPTLNDEYLRFGSLSEAIFWGHDAIVTTGPKNIESISPSNIAYFDRGFESPPIPRHSQARIASHAEKLIFDLLKNDIEALVLPIRLARQLLQKIDKSELQLEGLYSREPFEYRWIISHEDEALQSLLGHFLNGLNPIESGQLFTLGDFSSTSNKSDQWSALPWLSTLTLLVLGSLLLWRLQQKQSLQRFGVRQQENQKEEDEEQQEHDFFVSYPK